MSADKVFNSEEKAKLITIINEGMTLMQEVEDLSAGLNDTIKAVAEEMQIKPAVLKKAIKVAHKGNFAEATDDYTVLENILTTTGKQ